MGANGIAGFGVSDITFLDRAHERGFIESRNFIIRLLPFESKQQSGVYYNRLPPDILARTHYLPLSNNVIWVGILINQIGSGLFRRNSQR